MKQYTTFKISNSLHNSIQILHGEILLRGINSFKAPWIRELLSSGRPLPTKESITGAAIICLVLVTCGKTLEEVNTMSKEEVILFLKKNQYPLPPQWN